FFRAEDGIRDRNVTGVQTCALPIFTEFFNEDTAKQYRDAAIQELTAQGVTFPVKVQMPYNPSTPDWDRQCQVFKQQLEGVLNDGADFIDVILTAGHLHLEIGRAHV